LESVHSKAQRDPRCRFDALQFFSEAAPIAEPLGLVRMRLEF
jgi:hypothetical protein